MADAPVESLSFELALKELEGIVETLEKGEVALEQSIAMYERGKALKDHCEARLRAAELRVEQIVQGRDGRVTTEPAGFD
jgi:exodeoxyribonuclease VII small subunit